MFLFTNMNLKKICFFRRTCFREQLMAMSDNNVLQLELFFPMSTFTLHWHTNRQKCRYWSSENPY